MVFVGSPTILIDGVDPFGVAGQSPAFACRVYATPAGLSGVPPLGDVISALPPAIDRERVVGIGVVCGFCCVQRAVESKADRRSFVRLKMHHKRRVRPATRRVQLSRQL